jgi:hypothetical protein
MIKPKLKAALNHTHYLLTKPEGYELYLTDPETVPVFLAEMEQVMEEFSLEKLANYIQYFVIGHPFQKVNFSICMAQVNVILSTVSLNPYLDFACFGDGEKMKTVSVNKARIRVTAR